MSISKGTLFIFSAPSGAGKTTLVKKLLKSFDKLECSISYTTRKKRIKEKEGLDYYFILEDQFLQMQKREEFLESAKVFGAHYGTSLKTVFEKLERGIDIILEIDWQGARQVRERYKDVKSVFILPPSKNELLNRLTKRASDSKNVISFRMNKAKREMSHYDEYDYIVVNDNFNDALLKLKSIIIAERLKFLNQKDNLKELLKDLLEIY